MKVIGKTFRDPHVFHPNFSAAVVGDPHLSNYREDRVRPNKTEGQCQKALPLCQSSAPSYKLLLPGDRATLGLAMLSAF